MTHIDNNETSYDVKTLSNDLDASLVALSDTELNRYYRMFYIFHRQ